MTAQNQLQTGVRKGLRVSIFTILAPETTDFPCLRCGETVKVSDKDPVVCENCSQLHRTELHKTANPAVCDDFRIIKI